MYFSLMLGRVMLTCDSFALVGWTATPKGGFRDTGSAFGRLCNTVVHLVVHPPPVSGPMRAEFANLCPIGVYHGSHPQSANHMGYPEASIASPIFL